MEKIESLFVFWSDFAESLCITHDGLVKCITTAIKCAAFWRSLVTNSQRLASYLRVGEKVEHLDKVRNKSTLYRFIFVLITSDTRSDSTT